MTTIKLTLTNFRCHESKTIEISCGLGSNSVLLHGPSGTGKTTILNAILWIITGKLKKVATFGKKAVKVEIIWKNSLEEFTIVRGHTPSSLSFTNYKGCLNGDEAQVAINKIFGNYFATTSYIEQDSLESFVFMPPSDKAEFLEKLLLMEHYLPGTSLTIEGLTNKLKNELTKTKDESGALSSKISTLKNVLKDIISPVVEESLVIGRITVSSQNFLEVKEKLKSNIETVEKNIYTCDNNLRKINDSLNTKKNLDAKRSEYELLASKATSERLHELEDLRESYIKSKEWRDLTRRLKIVKDKMNNQVFDYNHFLTIKTQSELYKKVEDLSNQLLPDEEETVIRNAIRIAESKNISECPSCLTRLVCCKRDSKWVLKISENVDTVGPALCDDLDLLVKQISKHDTVYEMFIKCHTQLEELVELDNWENIETEFKSQCDLRDCYNDLEKLECSLRNVPVPESSLQNESDFLKTMEEMGFIKDAMNRLERLKNNISHLETEYKPYEITPESMLEKLEDLKKRYKEYKTNNEALLNWERSVKDNERASKIQNDIESSSKRLDTVMERLRGLNKLKDLVKYSETKCIEDFINSLNAHAKIYIDQFFIDADISVVLKNNKKEGVKSQLVFSVDYRKMTDCDLTVLSGGERDRVNLAFTLAFCEMTQNKVLLLDECISSLDEVNSSNVLDILSESYKGLVFVVSHQIVQGSFIQKIDL